MSGRQSSAVAKALRLVQRGHSASEASRLAGCDVRSLRRALRAAGVDPLPGGRPKSA